MAPAELTYNFLINPKSGKGKKDSRAAIISDYCRKERLSYKIFYTEYPGHAKELAEKITAEDQVIVAVGGDGTIHEIAAGIKDSPGCLGLLPAGSGNGLARHLGISMDMKQALSQLTRSSPVKMDLLIVNDQLSINIAGIGFDGYIAGAFANQTSRGLAGYAKLITKNFFNYREFDFELEMNQTSISGKAFSIAFCNGSQYGNQTIIAPDGEINDGLIDIVVIRKPGIIQLPRLLYQVLSGKLKSGRLVTLKKTANVSVRLKVPTDLQVDGEFAGQVKNLSIQVKPSTLNILRPIAGSN